MTRRSLLQLSTLLALVGAVLIVGAMAASAKPAKPSAVGGSLKFTASITAKSAYDVLIANFKRIYPNVNIESQFVVAQTYPQVLFTQLQAGTGPDVMGVLGGTAFPPSVIALAREGHLVDLSSSPWAKRLPAPVKPLVSIGNRPYMWMLGYQTAAIFYNQDLFRQLGLTVPKTFNQLLALCRSIRQKAPDKIPIAAGFGSFVFAAGTTISYASNELYAKDPNWNSKRAAGNTTFAATAGWRNALQRVVDMKNANCFSPSAGSDSPPQNHAQFASGRAVMQQGFDSFAGLIRPLNPSFKFSMFPPPATAAATTRLTVFPAEGLAVNSKSQNKEAARAFIDFMARQKQNTLWAKIGGQVAPYDYARAANPKIGGKALDADHQVFVPYLSKITVSGSTTWPSTATTVALGSAVQGLFTGQKSIDDVLKAADDSWGK